MAEFLTTNGTSYHIENIIIGAERELVLVSPYLQISKTFYERLKDAAKRGVIVTIIYGKDQLKKNEKRSLGELQNIELYFFENLHAKCYFNEKEMVITSMNMYEFSEKNNREMGVFIKQKEDASIFIKAANETKSIIESSSLVFSNRYTSRDRNNSRSNGFCIRCSEEIDYNVTKPYCRSCYKTWAQFENYNYEECFCHNCGVQEYTTMNQPECYNCYSETVNGKKYYK